MFILLGAIGLAGIVPLFMMALRPENEAPYATADLNAGARHSKPLTFASLGGYPFLLLLFSYVMQGMLFWGVTLWIPLAGKSVGFSGAPQAIASSLPYLMAVVLAWPISRISDRTGKRVLIASLGLLIPRVLMMLLPTVDSGYAKLALITLALDYYASSYSPNIWSILQSTIEPESIGTASGIINGIGVGGGGTLAGLLVGALFRSTGSYMPGFVTLGGLVVLGGVALLVYGRLAGARRASAATQRGTRKVRV